MFYWVLSFIVAAITSGTFWKFLPKFPTLNFPALNPVRKWSQRNPRLSTFNSPIPISKSAEITDTVDRLNHHLRYLHEKLRRKIIGASENKSRCLSTQDKITKLDAKTYELKKFCNRIQYEVACNERDCVDLKIQIINFLKLRENLQRDILSSPKFVASYVGSVPTETILNEKMNDKTDIKSELISKETVESKAVLDLEANYFKTFDKIRQGLCAFQCLHEDVECLTHHELKNQFPNKFSHSSTGHLKSILKNATNEQSRSGFQREYECKPNIQTIAAKLRSKLGLEEFINKDRGRIRGLSPTLKERSSSDTNYFKACPEATRRLATKLKIMKNKKRHTQSITFL